MNSDFRAPDFVLSHGTFGGILRNQAHFTETYRVSAAMAVFVEKLMHAGLFFFGHVVCGVSHL